MGRLPDLASIDITPQLEAGIKIIHGYGDGFVNISGERITHDVILTPLKYKEYTCPDDVLEFLDSNQIVLYGCDDESYVIAREQSDRGNPSFFNVPATQEEVDCHDPSGLAMTSDYEQMSFAAACRTYNVLVSEGRSVIAILRFKHG